MTAVIFAATSTIAKGCPGGAVLRVGAARGNRVARWEPIVPLLRPTGGRPRLVRLDPLRPAARGRGARGDPIQQRDHVLDLGAIEPLRDEYDLAAAVIVRPAVEP